MEGEAKGEIGVEDLLQFATYFVVADTVVVGTYKVDNVKTRTDDGAEIGLQSD